MKRCKRKVEKRGYMLEWSDGKRKLWKYNIFQIMQGVIYPKTDAWILLFLLIS